MSTTKEYLEEQIDEKLKALVEARAQKYMDEQAKKDAKDTLIQHGTKTLTQEDAQIEKDFFLALASRDHSAVANVNARVEKQYAAYREKAGQTEGTPLTGTAGGALVPVSLADSIIEQLKYISPIRQIARVIADMPAQLYLPNESNIVTAYWEGEGVAGTVSNEVFAPNVLTPQKLLGLDTFSIELLQDAATNLDVRRFVENRFAVAIALAENAAFVNGTGSGQPWGFRSSQITPLSTTQAGAGLAYSDLTKAFYTMTTGYRQEAVWLVSSAGLQALMNVKDTQGRPIWIDSFTGMSDGSATAGAQGIAVGKVLGRPVYLIDEIPSNLGAGTNLTEVWLVVPSRYVIGDRMGLTIDYGTNGTDFAQGQISLRVMKRVAGMPIDSSAFLKINNVLTA